jgi:branched-chain amino acid transport system permease protein
MTDPGTILNFLVAGIVTGGLYALVAVGLTLIYSVMKVVNVAHGDLMTLGAYVLVVGTGSAFNISLWMVAGLLLLALASGAVAGAVVEAGLIAPVLRSNREVEQRVLVLTLGLSLLLANSFQSAFGSDVHQVPLLVQGTTMIGSVAIANQRLAMLTLSIVLVALLLAFLRYTRLGLAIRATADHAEGAQTCGMNTKLVFMTVFALATSLAAGAGMFVAPLTAVSPTMGFPFTIKAFIVVIVGGLGSLSGALAASYLLGIAESLAVLWLPSNIANLVGPLLLLAVLFARPSGLFGRRVGRT